jgi:hypothetical protein
LTALEQRLRADLSQPSASAAAAGSSNGEALRRVRTLVDESERRQQTELALRLAEAMREVNAQRQADLVRIDRNIGAMQNNTGREMLRQRNEMLNYVSLRTASQDLSKEDDREEDRTGDAWRGNHKRGVGFRPDEAGGHR